MDLITLALAKNYANKVAAGFSNVAVDGSNIKFTLNDGSMATVTIPTPADGKDGAAGVSVTNLSIDTDGSLLCHMSDGSTIDAGLVPTVDPDLTNYYTKEEIDANRVCYKDSHPIETILKKDNYNASFYAQTGNNGTHWACYQTTDKNVIAKIYAANYLNVYNGVNDVWEKGLPKKTKTVIDNGVETEVCWFGNDEAFSAFAPLQGMENTGEMVSVLCDPNVIIVCARVNKEDVGKLYYTNCIIESAEIDLKKLDNIFIDTDIIATKQYVDNTIGNIESLLGGI